MKYAKPQHGFLLLGLLIYAGLSLLILLACYQIALQLEWRNQQIQTRLRAEQNLSLAREVLVAAIAGAHLNNQGSLAAALTRLNLVNDPEQRMVLTVPVQVYGARDPIAASWGLTSPGSGQKAPDSMILVIRSIVGQGAKLAKDLKPGSSEIALSQNTTA